jgi:hypothetical protein
VILRRYGASLLVVLLMSTGRALLVLMPPIAVKSRPLVAAVIAEPPRYLAKHPLELLAE